MIVAIGGDPSVLAAKVETASIPIVFATGGDALVSGLVASLNRPTENVTGVSFLNGTLGPKRPLSGSPSARPNRADIARW